ncbi:MAG: hypothetical protein AB7U82_06515, partial [Blastocatellales bacterium]
SWTALLLAMLVWLPVKRATTGSGLSPDQISPAYPGAPKAAKGAKKFNRKGCKEGKDYSGCQYPDSIQWALTRASKSKNLFAPFAVFAVQFLCPLCGLCD